MIIVTVEKMDSEDNMSKRQPDFKKEVVGRATIVRHQIEAGPVLYLASLVTYEEDKVLERQDFRIPEVQHEGFWQTISRGFAHSN